MKGYAYSIINFFMVNTDLNRLVAVYCHSKYQNEELIIFTIYGILDCICNELETKDCAISSFNIDAFIPKATLMAEWTKKGI